MSCPGDEVLRSYLEGDAGPEVRQSIQSHLDDCDSCRKVAVAWVRCTDSKAPVTLAPRSFGLGTAPEPGEPEELTPGSAIDRFRVIAHLGSGAMGAVYEALDPKLERNVAVKIFHADTAGSKVDSLIDEAVAMARLSDPNVVQVYEAGLQDDRVFVAMELVRGPSLRKWLAEAPRSSSEVLRVFLQAASGLAAIHRAGLIHRDFKPDNVVVGDDGRVRVTDFGLARPLDEEGASTAAGTPSYMAPEVLAGSPAGPKADQFAFAVSLYEALLGERPFKGRTLVELREAMKSGPPPLGRIPRRLRALIGRGLSANPENRFAAMDEVEKALRRSQSGRRQFAVIGTAAVTVAVTGTVWFWMPATHAPCATARDELSAVWNDSVRADVQVAFGAIDSDFAQHAWHRVEPALDHYAVQWRDMRVEVCEATRIRGTQSDEVMTARMMCLDRRSRELQELIEVFKSGDREVSLHAVSAVDSLSSVAECGDVETLLRTAPALPSDVIAMRVDQARATLDRARAFAVAGRHEAARSLDLEVVERARELGYDPLTAEALYRLANSHEALGEYDLASAAANEALGLAESNHHDRLAARIWQLLYYVEIYRLGKTELESRWRARAEAAIARVGGSPDLEIELVYNRGIVAQQLGNHAEAAERFATASAFYEAAAKTDESMVLKFASTQNSLGYALSALGKLDDAIAAHERARALREKRLGAEHPDVATIWNGLGAVHSYADDYAKALASFRRAREIAQSALGPEHPKVATYLGNEARMLVETEQPLAAVAALRRALTIKEGRLGSDHPSIADTLTALGRALLASEKASESAAVLERALKIRVSGQSAPGALAETQFFLAQALWASGARGPRTLKLAEESAQNFEAGGALWAAGAKAARDWLAEHRKVSRSPAMR